MLKYPVKCLGVDGTLLSKHIGLIIGANGRKNASLNRGGHLLQAVSLSDAEHDLNGGCVDVTVIVVFGAVIRVIVGVLQVEKFHIVLYHVVVGVLVFEEVLTNLLILLEHASIILE